MPVNFTQWGNLQNRYGGASILRPQRLAVASKMTLNWLSVLGNNLTLSSGNVDGRDMIGNHDDDAQGIAYDSSTEYQTLVDPLTQDDQNTPPYYFNLAFMWWCNDSVPWGPTCSNKELRSIGLAEYLKNDNYNTSEDGTGPGGTFEIIACHQRIFADLAGAFPATMPTYTAGGDYDEVNGPTSVSSWNDASFELVYSWDYMPIMGENGNAMEGRLYPLDPDAGCGSGGPGA